jgi:hypothetical protein
MKSTVVRSHNVAERVRKRLASGEHPMDHYHVGIKYDSPVLDSYYIGDERNGVMVLCEPVGDKQRVCAVSYCRYDPPGVLVEMVCEVQ